LRQVRVFEPETEVPENILRIGCGRRTPYIFSDEEILRLMAAGQQDRLRHTLRPLTLCTLIGLLASTGLRIGEAIRLKLEEAQLATDPPLLLISQTKFAKSRQVPLHASAAEQLRAYAIEREKAFPGRSAESFFVNRCGRTLEYNSLHATFRRLLRRAGIRRTPGRRAPTFHSFRHTFAVNRLTRWHREGKSVQDLLTHLAVYLGHIGPENTYWYVSATPELLDAAAARFLPPCRKGGR
jgi:integrase/recombinase XerD